MTIGFSYDDTDRLGRIQIVLSGYSATADYARVERSIDQVNWSVIRGGDAVPLSSGAGSIYDYEFAANTLNYYRVTAVDAATPTYVGVGGAAVGNNASLNPALPAGLVDGGSDPTRDLMVLIASIRNSGTGTVNVPAGWTSLVNSGNVRVMTRRYVTGDLAPTVTFTGGVANADTMARVFALRGSTATGAVGSAVLNPSAQNVAVPATEFAPGMFSVRFMWKQDDSAGMSFPVYTNIFTDSTTTGDDSALAAAYKLQTAYGIDPTDSFVVAGGASAISRGISIGFPKTPFTNQETSSFTPAVSRYRIKSPTRPSLNTVVEPIEGTLSISRPQRSGLFDVLNRTMPVAVVDLAGSRRVSLSFDVYGDDNKEAMDNVLATGGIYYLETPKIKGAIPTLYFLITDYQFSMDTKTISESYSFTLDMTEVARPASTVYGNTTIWQDIIDDFASWSTLQLAEPTWSDVVDRISVSDIIVP